MILDSYEEGSCRNTIYRMLEELFRPGAAKTIFQGDRFSGKDFFTLLYYHL